VRFVAADMLEANELVVKIMAVVAQADLRAIAARLNQRGIPTARGYRGHQCGLNRGPYSLSVFTSVSMSWIAPSPTVPKPLRPLFGSAATRIEQSCSEPSSFAGPTSRLMSFGGG
jgi:hypothetical protein